MKTEYLVASAHASTDCRAFEENANEENFDDLESLINTTTKKNDQRDIVCTFFSSNPK